MAIIDLRHLVEPECDIVQIVGSIDKKEYELPIKKTMGMVIILNQYFADYMKTVDNDTIESIKNIELNYRMITAWIRGIYPEINIEWVKNNISTKLFTELVKIIEPVFFPEAEAGMPERPRKGSKS